MSVSTEAPTRNTRMVSAVRNAQQEESNAYVMPKIKVGQTCLWFPDRSTTEGFGAIVTQGGERAIAVNINYPGSPTMLCKNGVRFKFDPDTDIIDRSEEGVWDFAMDADALNAAAIREIGVANAQVATLKEEVVELEETVVKLADRVTALEESATK